MRRVLWKAYVYALKPLLYRDASHQITSTSLLWFNFMASTARMRTEEFKNLLCSVTLAFLDFRAISLEENIPLEILW